MNFQKPQLEKLEGSPEFIQIEPEKFVQNATQAVVFQDPITNRTVTLMGSASMTLSMKEYAEIRVPPDIAYNIINVIAAPNEAIPELVTQEYTDQSLTMFYKYLNAL